MRDDIEAKQKAMFHSPAGGLEMMLKAASSLLQTDDNDLMENKTIQTNQTNRKRKRKQTHKDAQIPCPHCGQLDHARITSQLCPYNKTYRNNKKQKQQHHSH